MNIISQKSVTDDTGDDMIVEREGRAAAFGSDELFWTGGSDSEMRGGLTLRRKSGSAKHASR